MKHVLILDDGADSNIALQLLLRQSGYHVTLSEDAAVCLRILTTTSLRYVLCVGNDVEALAMLLGIVEEPELWQHVYVAMVEQGESLPAFVRRAVADIPLLVIQRPLGITQIKDIIGWAERLI